MGEALAVALAGMKGIFQHIHDIFILLMYQHHEVLCSIAPVVIVSSTYRCRVNNLV
jgi:hypothetical protein